jgi:hypothetical protein
MRKEPSLPTGTTGKMMLTDSDHRPPPAAGGTAPSRGVRAYGFHRPPYADPVEVGVLIRLALEQRLGTEVELVRTLESGMVEEQALVAVEQGRRTLLLRVWPVFYTDTPRVEYRWYELSEALRAVALRYLSLLVDVNGMELIRKG